MTDSTDLLWPPEEMASLMDALARSADRYNSSYGETAHLARNAAKTIRALAAPQALAATPAVGGEVLAKRLDNMARHQQENLTGKGRFNNFLNGNLAHEAAAFIRAIQPASPLRGTAHKVMTPEEYTAMPIVGWHEVCRNVDGFGGVGVRYISASPPEQPAADPVCDDPADVWEAYCAETPAKRRSPQGALAFGFHAASDKQPLRYGEPVWPGNENDDLDKGSDA